MEMKLYRAQGIDTFKTVTALISGLLFCALLAGTVAAQTTQDPKDTWVKVCENGTDGVCYIRRVLMENTEFRGSVLLRTPDQNDNLMLVVGLPTGLDLRQGMALRFEDGTEVKLPYMICDTESCTMQANLCVPSSCPAELKSSGEFFTRFLDGEMLTVVGVARDGSDHAVDFDFSGFEATYSGSDFISVEDFDRANE